MDIGLPESILKQALEQGLFKDQLIDRLAILCWVMLAASAGIWVFMARSKRGYDITAVYWLACGLSIWICLHFSIEWVIPASMLSIALISILFTYVPILMHHRRRYGAWPDRLEDLTVVHKPFGGFITSVTALSLIIFFLGLCYITSANTARVAFLMAISLLILVQYDYRAEAALAGMVLLTLATVSAFLDLCNASTLSTPTIMNLVIIPLGFMSFLWVWLGRVWRQQIHNKKPLTTSARMVPLTLHVGIMLLGFSTLLAVKLATWPRMPANVVYDNHTGRLVLMAVAFGILLAANVWIALRVRTAFLGALAALNLFAAVLAYVIRMPFFFHNVFMPNWKIIVAVYILVATIAVSILSFRSRPRFDRR